MQVMPRGQAQTIRKGTKSCTECRRRKIRCIQSFDNEKTCRRCEERGSECIAQTHTSGSTGKQKLSSKSRIAQLESNVFTLTETMRRMQQKLNDQATQTDEFSPGQTSVDSWDGESAGSELSIAEQPFHLRSLFHNDWLSMDGLLEGNAMQRYEATNTACLLSFARSSLQRFIPSKDEISDLAGSASEWLSMLHSFFPLPCGAKCGQEVVASYEEMYNPNVDAIRLASWLLTVALIIEQLPPEHKGMNSRVDQRARRIRLSRAISETVKNKILDHDTLTGSIQGLSLSMQFIRLEMGRGNLHKAWVKLRHVIAIAELIGLHNMVQADKLDTTTGTVDGGHISKVQLWNLICAADRLLGMLLNLPPVTGRHQQATTHSVLIGGVVQNQVYLYHLTNIANKIQDLDHLSRSNRPRTEVSAFVSKLSRELKVLASQTPESWWSGGVHGVKNVRPDHIVQFLHCYVAMRVHLPLFLRQDPENENLSNCFACVDACESVVQRYQFLSRRLPRGLFLSEMLDLQAFSAAVTLLLISHESSVRSLEVGIDKIKIGKEVGQVIKLLNEKSNNPPGSGTAHDGFTTLRSLDDLLREPENGFDPHQITFQVPLLGKMQIRRNKNFPQADTHWPSPLLSVSGFCNPDEEFPNLNFDANMSMEPFFESENEQWDRTASSIEDILRGLL